MEELGIVTETAERVKLLNDENKNKLLHSKPALLDGQSVIR